MCTRSRFWLLVSLSVGLLVLAGLTPPHAAAQPTLMGAHHAARGTDSGYGAGQVSPTGGYSAQLPIDAPPARGGVPVPLAIVYNAGNRVGEAGQGWSVPFSYITRSTSLTRRRPVYHRTARAPAVRERVELTLSGSTFVMLRDGNVYRAIRNAPALRPAR